MLFSGIVFGKEPKSFPMKTSAPAGAPVYQAPPPDPALAVQAAQASKDQIDALQTKVQGDSASMMARYGSLFAMMGAGK
jgi:hypothetical protein